MGLGAGNLLVGVVYQPAFVAGSARGRLALGVRNELRVEALWGTSALEVGHHAYAAPAGVEHEVHVTLTADPIPLVYLIAAVAQRFSSSP